MFPVGDLPSADWSSLRDSLFTTENSIKIETLIEVIGLNRLKRRNHRTSEEDIKRTAQWLRPSSLTRTLSIKIKLSSRISNESRSETTYGAFHLRTVPLMTEIL